MQSNKQILVRLRAELISSIDKSTQASYQRFFKEPVKYYGIKNGVVDKIAFKYWQEIKNLNKNEIFALCEKLYRTDYTEEAFVVANWVPRLTEKFERTDLQLFYQWIKTYVNNWAKCDNFCNHTVGNFISKYPDMVVELESWAESENRWLRRAAAVSLIVPVKRGQFLDNVFRISDILLLDKDDLVQKGYGWLLKEASRLHQDVVFRYVIRNKKIIPRTSLRYAVELMPAELRAEAMRRDKTSPIH